MAAEAGGSPHLSAVGPGGRLRLRRKDRHDAVHHPVRRERVELRDGHAVDGRLASRPHLERHRHQRTVDALEHAVAVHGRHGHFALADVTPQDRFQVGVLKQRLHRVGRARDERQQGLVGRREHGVRSAAGQSLCQTLTRPHQASKQAQIVRQLERLDQRLKLDVDLVYLDRGQLQPEQPPGHPAAEDREVEVPDARDRHRGVWVHVHVRDHDELPP
mmetsp:Transcript_20270/g.53181  ORF Transcript_20270/g.53181 Transcript_20270/m.53181 type:complete len:217 (+) Transcript_20270:138-788(+)